MIPSEMDLPSNHGFTMNGWNFTRAELAEAMKGGRMLNPAFELASNFCPWNCEYCFTEDPANREGAKRRLANEMPFEDRLTLIDAAADLGTRSINFVGAGEPTIDPHFWDYIERMRLHDITPIIYTEGALKCTDRDFASRLFDMGATVVFKVNTLEDAAYQNAIVAGPPGRKAPSRHQSYFADRNKAIELLKDIGFNKPTPTRLAFDTIICRENIEEIPRIHTYARDNNIFVLFVNYIPAGRAEQLLHNAISHDEQFAVFARLAEIDSEKYGIEHGFRFPYAGGVPCTIRGFGLYVKVGGKVFDCPGESQALGDLRGESLATIWKRAHDIQQNFDGGCLPRKLFWDDLLRRAGP